MTLETEIYQILKKHRLSLNKREELIVDLLDFINKREEAITVTRCSTQLKDKEAPAFEEWLNTKIGDSKDSFYDRKNELSYNQQQLISLYTTEFGSEPLIV